MQWLIWNPWGIAQILGLSAYQSYLVASERWAPTPLSSAPELDSNTKLSTNTQVLGPTEVIETEEEEEALPPLRIRLSRD